MLGNVFCFFVDFEKTFDSLPRHLLLQRMCDIGIIETFIVYNMELYEMVMSRFVTTNGLSNFVMNTTRVTKGCPFH